MKNGSQKILYLAPRLGLVLVSIFIALLIVEIGLWLYTPVTKPLNYINLHELDDTVGYKMKPGYRLTFDDGIAHGEVRINSLGFRDDEPQQVAKKRILFVGDSFTFGDKLDQTETIDAVMEKLEEGLEVENLGVMGYNLPQQLEPLRNWKLPADEVVYLFFPNDFTVSESTVIDGYLFPRRARNGHVYTDEELRERVTDLEKPAKPKEPVFNLSRLHRVRKIFRNFIAQIRNPPKESSFDVMESQMQYYPVSKAIGYTQEMREMAEKRNMKFHVAILPWKHEAENGKYLSKTGEYVEELKKNGFDVIELLPHLSIDDYWQHDGHFNPEGAKIAARVIYKAINKSEK